MRVAHRMSRSLVTIERGARLIDAARRMCDGRVGAILVMDGSGLVGILTERDVLQVFAQRDFDASVQSAMTRQPETIDSHASLEDARLVMLHGGFRHLPVVDDDQVVGVLSMRDLLSVDAFDAAPRGV